jgi:hypothetical protein
VGISASPEPPSAHGIGTFFLPQVPAPSTESDGSMGTQADTAFERPTSVILLGSPGALLNWVALGFASTSRGGYFWTDVRLPEQRIDDRDPLARAAIPSNRLSVVQPQELSRNDAPANAALSMVVRADDDGGTLRQLADFIRLPTHTQALIAAQPPGDTSPLVVLSNAQRIAPLYPEDAVAPVVKAIVGAGVSLFVTYADEAPQGRLDFENVWHLKSRPASSWPEAWIEVEKASAGGPYEAGAKVEVRAIPRLAGVLGQFP